EFVAVVRALGMFQVEDERQIVALIIFRGQVLFLERAVGQSALAGIVNPTDQVVVVGFLAYTAQIRGERSALLLAALSHGMAGHAAAGFERLATLLRIARLLRG